MSDSDKLVFISYRRSTSKYLARLIFDRLRAAGFDVFLDVNTIDSGAFDSMILRQIGARPHFVLLISPSALERCTDAKDWLRLEIEEAMRLGRNVIPLMEEGVDFTRETDYLPEHLRADFRRYNSIPLVHFYFDAAIDMLVNRFLKQPVHGIRLLAPSPVEQKIVEKQVESVAASPAPTKDQLSAEQYLNRGYKKYEAKNLDGAIADYNQAIHLDPQYATAYNIRGVARFAKGDNEGAVADYDKAIQLNPQYDGSYNNRGNVRKAKGDLDGAIADYNEALRLNPQSALAYNNRGNARKAKGDLDGAIADYNKALLINPKYIGAYNNRAIVHYYKKNYNFAITDYNKALRLDPKDASIYSNRGEAYFAQRNYEAALKDFKQANELRPAYNMTIGGMATTQHALGNISEARRLWKTLIAQNEKFRNVEWVQKEFNWADPLVEEARKLVAKL